MNLENSMVLRTLNTIFYIVYFISRWTILVMHAYLIIIEMSNVKSVMYWRNFKIERITYSPGDLRKVIHFGNRKPY